MPRIAVVFTGGTISMRHDGGSGGNVPTLRAQDLLSSVPGIDRLAQVEPIDWGLVPASHLTFDQVLEIGGILEGALARPEIDGAVVVQGTDVIEETAFAWDLLPLPAKPVVVVGAMRSASQPGYDGPENLRNAIAAATDPALAGAGVIVAMAGELHAADDVRKTNTHAYATFQSPNTGRLGYVVDGRVTLRRSRRPARLPRRPERAASPIQLVTAVLDGDREAVVRLLEPRPAGLVVAATGAGNTAPWLLDAAATLIADGVPVALTTRCPSGSVRPGYAFPGGSSGWWEAGALFTGALDPLKARVLLALGLGGGATVDELAELCRAFGGGWVGARKAGETQAGEWPAAT